VSLLLLVPLLLMLMPLMPLMPPPPQVPMGSMIDLYNGGGIDVAFLGMAQVVHAAARVPRPGAGPPAAALKQRWWRCGSRAEL
jgi:hypothetical protein